MNSPYNTPILFLIFNRPEISNQVFLQIREIRPRSLYIGADGPRSGNLDDQINCNLTRAIIDKVDWDCEVKKLYRDENLGCGVAVCSAISWFFEQVEEGIILEDDCFPDLSFFRFCDEMLTRYKNDKDIFLISGTNLQNGNIRGSESYFFSNYPETWGWASWRRAWDFFEHDILDVNLVFKSGVLNHVFQSTSEKHYWWKKIQMGVNKKRSIWDYQWWFAIWKNQGLAISPNTNLVVNLGFRNTGSHDFLRDSVREPEFSNPILFPLKHPINKTINRQADQFTYQNVFSYSLSRMIRLIRENGIVVILRYSFLKLRFFKF